MTLRLGVIANVSAAVGCGDQVDPASVAGAEVWAHYRSAWVAWNNVRTLAAIAATLVLTLSLRWG